MQRLLEISSLLIFLSPLPPWSGSMNKTRLLINQTETAQVYSIDQAKQADRTKWQQYVFKYFQKGKKEFCC